MTTGNPSLEIAVLLVNGKNSEYGGQLWLEICLEKIIKYTEMKQEFKIFLWNHDLEQSDRISNLTTRNYPYVLYFDECSRDVNSTNSPTRTWRKEADNPLNWYGFHAHRTALQLLYEEALKLFDVDIFITLDTDSWPIKFGWDRFFAEELETHKLIGVWRNELKGGIKPFVHPSGVGIKANTIVEENFRFDKWPANAGEDSLSHFSRHIYKKYGRGSISMLKRSNIKNIHFIFGGIYGDWIYHHHQGTRFTNNMEPIFKGSAYRGESVAVNSLAIELITDEVFFNYDAYIAKLRGK